LNFRFNSPLAALRPEVGLECVPSRHRNQTSILKFHLRGGGNGDLATEKERKSMARTVNKVTLLGNVGKDPEIRSTPGGTMVANLTLATSDRQKDAQGNWQDRTEWHNLVAFTRTAEIVRDYVKKGSKLYIEGKIQTRSWDDKESGQKRYRTEIIVNELVLLSGRDDGSGGGQGGYTRAASSSSSSANFDQRAHGGASDEFAQSAEISDDDIPF
jgi:single-strand DNA-binding protein